MPRAAILFPTVLLAQTMSGQLAVGAFGGASEDGIWHTGLAHAGIFTEFRCARLPAAVIRASVWFTPERHEHTERYRMVEKPEPRYWLASMTDERMRLMGAALDLKFPFEHNICLGGYYRGTYILAGIGYAQRWRTIDQWDQDVAGQVTATTSEKIISEPTLRAGFGGEWNFKWGGPFVEGLVTVSSPGIGPPALRFPGAVMLSAGYRYSFAKPRATETISY